MPLMPLTAKRREQKRQANRRWRERHLEQARIKCKHYQKLNAKKYQESTKKYLAERPWLMHLYEARTRCKSNSRNSSCYYIGKGIKCTLTREEIKYLWFRDNAAQMNRPSLDRKDSEKDYTVDNCQFMEFNDNSKKAYQYGLSQGSNMAFWKR